MGSIRTKHAVISGACSGIGLALARSLLDQPDWKVVCADIRPESWKNLNPPLDSSRATFVECDIADWDSHAALFKKAFEWTGGQIDFYAANAGIGDRESLLFPWDLEAEPTKPNLDCIAVCELANYYGMKLFVHYARKTQQRLGADHAKIYHPKVVMTASCVAQYPFPIAPQYSAAKHAILGYTRAIGGTLYAKDNITVNCIMPAVVDTGILPGDLKERWPKGWLTPLSTMVRAFQELIDETGKVQQDGKSDGKDGVVKTAQSVECALDRLYYREPVAAPDESQAFMVKDSVDPNGVWAASVNAVWQARVAAGDTSSSVGGQ
ncbi:Short-chain dehydrogenase 5 [Cyphellophora attinorum]|uniref:Short-chain dehydrogenase 5 n=1 Tax=Cyphellophora attinorum TaxID=1664694 RepID=A0A0N1HV93_9EURO|nr:Short-chain dehydrogenase 5 [Phialophora attinorum]KPI41132.1 Short-chain dehydrogenase 5 [Phialophora attinorum]